ncbi:MAG: M20/M25/M40 family metallo-hydrolase [Methanoregula sp.]|uniref:M20/M25/M40 family metallo-hydrolase n=2 Tax=Methanoregula sp. TaxID=2052170 RepID=UPI003C3E9FEA
MHPQQICSDLVKIRSENPPGNTSGVIEYIRYFLDALGVPSQVICSSEGGCNLVTTGTHRPLLFCGHADVVPALDEGWTYPPFSGMMRGGYVWGRGASDMKGGCAAILSACEKCVDSCGSLPASLVFVCDEETGGERGIQYLLEKNVLSPCDCLIAEPTPVLHPCIGQKGLCRLELKFTGTPGHGSLYPVVGVSAVMEAMRVLDYLKNIHKRSFHMDRKMKDILKTSAEVISEEFRIEKGSEILEHVTFNPGVINGGEKVNIVAQCCSLDLEMRIPWGCNIQDLVNEIMVQASHAVLMKETLHEPSLTDPLCDFASLVCREVGNVQEGLASPIVQWAASDARHLRSAGFRVIEYGPGELSTLHGTNERVAVESLVKAAAIYERIMLAYESKVHPNRA